MADTEDAAAFWRAIEGRPNDDLPVLILADYLDERGDPLGTTLRQCISSGTRPGRLPDGRAFWVTTTLLPVAAGRVRQGRRWLDPAPTRPQPSWLSGVYWKWLSAAQAPWPLIRYATVWRYVDAESAYRDLCHAQWEMRKHMVDPKTGKGAFDGTTNSRWRDEARRVIAVALSALPPGATDRERAAAVRDCYPFGGRRGHPYKMFLLERRLALGRAAKRSPAAAVREVACSWCGDIGCVACASKRWQAAGVVGEVHK